MPPNWSVFDRPHISYSGEEWDNANLKDVRKNKKLKGQTYTSATGKIMPHKKSLPIVCKCFKKFHNSISNSKQQDLNFKWFQFNSYDLQSAFLFGLIQIIDKKRVLTKNMDTPKRQFTREYYLSVENG